MTFTDSHTAVDWSRGGMAGRHDLERRRIRIIWNIIIGVAGSFLGGWIFKFLGISFGGISRSNCRRTGRSADSPGYCEPDQKAVGAVAKRRCHKGAPPRGAPIS